MLQYDLSIIETFPKGKGKIPLEKNNIYQGLLKIRNKLNETRDFMEPYFQKYSSLFRSVISNFGSFKTIKFNISSRYNTPSVSNTWITMYEICSTFNLIPQKLPEGKNQWILFSSENLPGSSILAIHHYINTLRNDDFVFHYDWFGSAPHNNELYKSEDIYNLYTNYTNNWITKQNNDGQTVRENGDVTNVHYVNYVSDYLHKKTINNHKVDLFVGNISLEVGKHYNEEEIKHNKIFLGQLFLCLNILNIGSHAILRNLTFFTKFNISMIAWMRNYFETFTICKAFSSKDDNSEIYFICKGFKGIEETELKYIENILKSESYNFIDNELIPLSKIKQTFWYELGKASAIFVRQIQNINDNIDNFNDLIDDRYPINDNKILRNSQKRFEARIAKDISRWMEYNPLKPLHQKRKLKINDTTKRRYTRRK